MSGKEDSGYILKAAKPTGFTAGQKERWESGELTVAVRILAWKQQERRLAVHRHGEDGERHRFGELSGHV